MAALTLGLQNLRNQINEAFPARDKTSDGWIGDTAHQATTSGHNPDDTAGSKPAWNGDPDTLQEVRAWDMDSDLRANGVTAQNVVDHLRSLPRLADVVRYMIYNHKIYHSRVSFAGAAYTGASSHEEHIHFDGAWTQASDNNTSFNYRLEEIPVALTGADKTWLLAAIDARADQIEANIAARISNVPSAVWSTMLDVDITATGVNLQPAGSILRYTSAEHHQILDSTRAVEAVVTAKPEA